MSENNNNISGSLEACKACLRKYFIFRAALLVWSTADVFQPVLIRTMRVETIQLVPYFSDQIYGMSLLRYTQRQTPSVHACRKSIPSDRLDLEMQSYQGKHQRFQILDEVIEDPQTFRILGFRDIDERANLSGLIRG